MRIATLGPQPLTVDAKTDPQTIVEQEIAHWQREFSQVLPDRPDLIVVPEACDRPAGLPRDKQLEYYHVRKNQVRDFFAKVAAENHCYIVYSAAREMDDATWRNSSVLINLQGQIVGNGKRPASFVVRNNLIDGPSEQIGEGNITGEAKFADAAQGDFHLLPSSPAIDVGADQNPLTIDADGNPRRQGNKIDIGAYETKL